MYTTGSFFIQKNSGAKNSQYIPFQGGGVQWDWGARNIHSINKKIFPYPFVFEHNITIKKYLASFFIYYINININITYKFLIIISFFLFFFFIFPKLTSDCCTNIHTFFSFQIYIKGDIINTLFSYFCLSKIYFYCCSKKMGQREGTEL